MLSTLYIFIKERDANDVSDANDVKNGICRPFMTASRLRRRQVRTFEGGCC